MVVIKTRRIFAALKRNEKKMIKDKELLDALVEQDIERISKILENVPILVKEGIEESLI